MSEASVPSKESRRSHAEVPSEVDVAVVGAGLGGLVAAATLARRGLKVACFDGHYVAGGCCTQFVRGGKKSRYHFDIGLHYVGDCGSDGMIPRILRELDASVDFVPMDPDGFDTLVFPDLTFRIPPSVELYRQRLLERFPHGRAGIDRYVRLLTAVMRAGRRLDLNDGRIGLRDGVALARDALVLRRYQSATMTEFFESAGITDPRLRAVMLGQSGDYGLPPSRVSAFLHMGLAAHYFRGAYYPRGGGQVIADRVAESFERAGGSLHLRHGVAKIIVRDGRAVGVKLEARAGGEAPEVRARAVLSNADLKATLMGLVGAEHLPASHVTRVPSMEMAAALFITFLGVKGDLRAKGMRATNYWQFDGYDLDGFYRWGSEKAESGGFRPYGCYVTSATLKDPDTALHHAPEGVSNVEVMTVVPPVGPHWGVSPDDALRWGYRDNEVYRARKKSVEDDMVNRLEAMFPGTRDAVVFRESATPVTHQRYTRASDGTGYGLAATPEQFLRNRPGYRGPLGGLYLCGANTRAGHGVVGAMMSGRQAAKRVAADLGR